MGNTLYILHIYNTTTGMLEDVEVTKEIYDTYRRLGYNANYRERKARKNETLFSHLIGGGDGGVENFHECRLDDEDPQLILDKRESIRELIEAIGQVPYDEVRLLLAFFLSGKSERKFAAECGMPHKTFYYRKEKILKRLRRILFEK
jgi:DNA-directed RNA polymerase specialized sigma24 family protein